MKEFIKELYLRVTMKSPDFFVKLRKLFLSMSGICAILTSSGVDFEIFGINVAKAATIASAGAAIITFLAVKDGDALTEKLEK